MLRRLVALVLVAALLAPVASALPFPRAYVEMNYNVRNDGTNDAGLPTSDRGFISFEVDPSSGVILDTERTEPTPNGILAYVGFLTGGREGIAGIWGEVDVAGFGCTYQTWGGENVDPALEPRVDCLA